MGFELTNTQTIIKRSGVFDEVDSKYGIPEEERKKVESSAAGGEAPGGDMMGGGAPPPPEPAAGGGEPPLSESKKRKIFGMLGEGDDLNELFDMEKARQNIYEIENKLRDILND
jgi:hypothetical protein